MTYPELVEFCGDERQVHFLSTKLPYQRMSEAELVDRRGRAHGSRQGTHASQIRISPWNMSAGNGVISCESR